MPEYQRPTLSLPEPHKKILLHSCCAPCSGEVMEAMAASGIDYSIFFYNPNIHPKREYEIRKEENVRFAQKHNIEFIDADYDRDKWFERVKGFENEPERGARFASTCASNARRFTPTSMGSTPLPVRWASRAGRT